MPRGLFRGEKNTAPLMIVKVKDKFRKGILLYVSVHTADHYERFDNSRLTLRTLKLNRQI